METVYFLLKAPQVLFQIFVVDFCTSRIWKLGFYDCPGTWTGMCRPRRTRRPIDTCPRAIQAIHTCVVTLAFIITIGYHRPLATRIRRTLDSAGSHTRRPAGWAEVPGPAAPAARRPLSARHSPRRRCWGPKCVLPRSNLVRPQAPPRRPRRPRFTCARIQPPVAETCTLWLKEKE